MNLSILIRIFSINGVFFGLVCIGVQVRSLDCLKITTFLFINRHAVWTQAGALTLFLLSYKDDYISNAGPSDLLGCGIWAGAIAIITGGVGIAASYRHSKALYTKILNWKIYVNKILKISIIVIDLYQRPFWPYLPSARQPRRPPLLAIPPSRHTSAIRILKIQRSIVSPT